MKLFIVSFAAGILVGCIYGLLHVRSPAPPAVALLGLLGMLIGEQLVPLASRAIRGEGVTVAWFAAECVPKICGTAPVKPAAKASVDTRHGDIGE